jgi:glycyl-tRNA synthetase beta chain
MVDISEREQVIVDGVTSLCAEHGWTAIIDDELLREVAHLVEWPFPMLGTFDEALLEVPREVLITSMKVHQRYFAVQTADSSLAPAFAFVCNAKVKIPEVVIAGNRRVLLARLEDARFFFREDKRRTLDERVEDLARVVYMEKLGSIAERVVRIEAIAASLADTLHAGDAELRATVVRAAHLCKSDLVTGMVGEFPELQGIMGRYYALASSPAESQVVAEAIAEHYQPRGASDAVAASPAGRVLALAEKLESIAGGFALGFAPTGSADPYALRRSAIGVLRTIMEGGYTLSIAEAVALAWRSLPADVVSKPKAEPAQIVTFLEGRLQSMLANQFPVDIVDAVVAVIGSEIPSAAARCDALNQLRAADGFEPLAAAYKRATNIVSKAKAGGWVSSGLTVDKARFELPEETVLADALADAAPVVADRTADKDFAGVANALIALKGPIDAFFDGVMVNAPDEAVRTNRLLLLEQTCQLFIGFADISRIQVTG